MKSKSYIVSVYLNISIMLSFFVSSHHLIEFVLRFTSYVAISTIKLISRFLFFYYIGYKDI